MSFGAGRQGKARHRGSKHVTKRLVFLGRKVAFLPGEMFAVLNLYWFS